MPHRKTCYSLPFRCSVFVCACKTYVKTCNVGHVKLNFRKTKFDALLFTFVSVFDSLHNVVLLSVSPPPARFPNIF